MSTDLYGIRILKKEPEQKKITIKVIVVYYDVAYESHEPLPMDKSLFLRVLWDEGRDAYIGTKISMDEFLNEDWINANAYRFIDHVKQLNTKNHPLRDYEGYHDFYYGDGPWKDEEKLVQADYEVYVHDARLLSIWRKASRGEPQAMRPSRMFTPVMPRLLCPILIRKPLC